MEGNETRHEDEHFPVMSICSCVNSKMRTRSIFEDSDALLYVSAKCKIVSSVSHRQVTFSTSESVLCAPLKSASLENNTAIGEGKKDNPGAIVG